MRLATRDITWIHEDDDGNPTGIGEFKFTVKFRRPESFEDCVALAGSDERVFDLLEQKQSTYPNPSKKKFLEAKDVDAAKLVIQQVIDAGETADLTTTRGTGVNAKAAKFDAVQTALDAAGDDMDAKLAALRAAGFNI